MAKRARWRIEIRADDHLLLLRHQSHGRRRRDMVKRGLLSAAILHHQHFLLQQQGQEGMATAEQVSDVLGRGLSSCHRRSSNVQLDANSRVRRSSVSTTRHHLPPTC